MRNIEVEFLDTPPLEEHPVELVERKGIGHPDSICDGLAEAVSRGLSREYLKRFDDIMHHNTDQVELVGGKSDPKFKGGEIIKPMFILLSGRATTSVGGEEVPVGEIALESARTYLKEAFPHLDVEKDVELTQRLGMGSVDLRDVFNREGIPNSNDTSFGVSFAPFTLTEQLVYDVEKYINGELKKKLPASGEDCKVMGVRMKDEITLTVAAAFISSRLDDYGHYEGLKDEMRDLILDYIAKKTNEEVAVDVNTGDNPEHEFGFITVTGTSAEMGDDGSVGRGNRANGLITPYRPMSLEATAGKNPVNHVGKIYNLLSKEIAGEIAEAGARQVYVRLMSQIGKPIDRPLCASVQVWGDSGVESKAGGVADYWLEHVTDITEKCVKGEAECF